METLLYNAHVAAIMQTELGDGCTECKHFHPEASSLSVIKTGKEVAAMHVERCTCWLVNTSGW